MRIRKTHPGTIVLIDAPFSDGSGSKVRPALVLARFGGDFIVAPMTSNLSRVDRWRTQTVIDPATCDTCGLKRKGVVQCDSLMTIAVQRVIKQQGYVDRQILEEVKKCLKATFCLK